MKLMNYAEFTELVRLETIAHDINITLSEDDIKVAFIAYTKFDKTFAQSIQIMLDKPLNLI